MENYMHTHTHFTARRHFRGEAVAVELRIYDFRLHGLMHTGRLGPVGTQVIVELYLIVKLGRRERVCELATAY